MVYYEAFRAGLKGGIQKLEINFLRICGRLF